MVKLRWILAAVIGVLALAATGCGDETSAPSSDGATTAKLLMNWFPQAETGGYYQAAGMGLDAKERVRFDVLPGGPQIQTIPQVASGQAQFGVAQADQLLIARAQGVPVVAVFAPLTDTPYCLMYHSNTGVKSVRDLSGRTVAVASGPRFWLWVKSHFRLSDVKEVTLSGGLAEFKRDKNRALQCFVTNEPWIADQQSIDHREFSVAELGYNPYGNVLFTTERLIKEDPELVERVVAASRAGWRSYLKNPAKGNQLILRENKDAVPGQLKFAVERMRALVREPIGGMTPQRWQTLAHQMRDAGILDKDQDTNAAFTTRFLK